ncbi:transcription elongation factor TFIIS-like [Populus alba x Populus x berolinensis]|nr:transcription elongation factor TFIIS-like [Populus alba x Populus x berolinensis]
MEKQFLSLFESAKKSAAIVATSASIFPEVYRCLEALDQLKRFPVTSSRVLVSTPVAKEVQYLTKHRVKMIRTAASCVLDAWSRNLYARNPAIDGKTQPTKSTSGSRTGSLIVKIQGRVIGRVKVNMPIQTEKKIKEEKENGFSCFKKPPQDPAMRCTNPGKVQSITPCFKKPSTKRITQQENVKDFCNFKKPSTKRITQQENVKDFCNFKKPSTTRITQQENVKDFCNFKNPSTKRITQQENVKDFCNFKKPSEEPVKCSDGLRSKVRHILAESLCRVAKEVKEDLMEAVRLRDPITVAADVESLMFERMGLFNGTKQLKYRSILFNMKDPKNPDLRRKVLLGQIKPEKLVTMTAEEMASDQRQLENDQIRKKSLWKEMNAEQQHKSVDPMEY